MPFGKHYNNIQIQQQTENIYQMEFWNTQLKITSKPKSKKLIGNTWKIEKQVDRNIPYVSVPIACSFSGSISTFCLELLSATMKLMH